MLAMLNSLLSFVEMRSPRAKQVQGFLFANLVDDELFDRAKEKFGRDQMDDRPIFHRQQLLTTMRSILLKANDGGALNPNGNNKEARYALGRLAAMMNDVIQPVEQSIRLKAGAQEAEKDRIHDELFVQLLPTVELSNPPNPARALIRNCEYLRVFTEQSAEFNFSERQTLSTKFVSMARIELHRYLELLYCIWARYEVESESVENLINEPKRFNVGRETFANMNVSLEELSALFDLVSSDIDTLTNRVREEARHEGLLAFHGFREFRERPLVYTSEAVDIATVIDMNFLVEKMSSGVFHTIAEVFRGEDDNRTDENDADYKKFIRRYWGDVFEIYVNERLSDVFSWSTTHFLASPTYDSPRARRGQQAFDALINYGGALVAIESKGKFLKLEAKYGENRELLIEDLDSRFGKAARQLAENIELCFNRYAELQGSFSVKNDNNEAVATISADDMKEFSSIYPLVIVQEHALQIGFANRWLRNLFQKEIANRNVDLTRVRRLSLITIEDLEEVIPCLYDISLVWILDEYAKNEDPLTSFKQVFRSLIRSRKIPNRPDKWLDGRIQALHNSIKPMFEDKEPN